MQLKSDISTLVVSWLFLQSCYTCALFETLLNNIGLKNAIIYSFVNRS